MGGFQPPSLRRDRKPRRLEAAATDCYVEHSRQSPGDLPGEPDDETLPLRLHLFGVAVLGLLSVSAAEPSRVNVTTDKDSIRFTVGDETAGVYLFGKEWVKPYLYPVNAPGGVAVTRTTPLDHIHQKSAWFSHGDVIPEGIELKHKKRASRGRFLVEEQGHGDIVCTSVANRRARKDLGAGHDAQRMAHG